MSKVDEPLGVVVVAGNKGYVHKEFVFIEKQLIWDALIRAWPVKEEKGMAFVFMPEKAAKYQKAKPMSCLYNAVDFYMNALLGRKMDSADHDFFDEHPLTGKNGVSQPNTLRVTHELTEPYGVCVSRVRVWPGTTIAGDLKQWMGVLGVNPLAMLDRQTSNKTFCEKTGLPEADADRQFRFEFSEEPLRPAISCGTYYEDDKGTKKIVGHASYESPRAPYLSHIMQFQLAHRDKVNWDKEPVFGDVENPNTDRQLALYSCLDQNGEPLYKSIETPKNRGSLPKQDSEGTTFIGPRGGFSSPTKKQIRTCFLCYSETGDRVGANICIRCWAIFLKDIACNECGHFLANEAQVSGLSGLHRKGADWFITITCGSCADKTELMCLPGTAANAVQKAIRGEEDGVVTGHNKRTQNTR